MYNKERTFLNESIPYGATVAVAICMILMFHKILYVSWIVKAVWHKYQNMPNISNSFGF